jgi:hypothetical protein
LVDWIKAVAFEFWVEQGSVGREGWHSVERGRIPIKRRLLLVEVNDERQSKPIQATETHCELDALDDQLNVFCLHSTCIF